MRVLRFVSTVLVAGAAGVFLSWAVPGIAGENGGARPVPESANTVERGDALDVSVFEHPELSRRVHVDEKGGVDYPFLGRLPAAGQSPDQLAERISNALATRFALRDVFVSITRAESPRRGVFALGYVKGAGRHDIAPDAPLTIVQLIALAGGFTPEADAAAVHVLRTLDDGRRGRVSVDLSGLLGGETVPEVRLMDGDVVVIPRVPEVSVLGQVNAPGPVPLRSGASRGLLAVLAQVRGFTRLADRDEVLLIRGEGADRVTRRLDVEKILEGRAPEPSLRAGDLVYVTERTF